MKLSSLIVRDKVPSLSVQHLTPEKNQVEMTYEGGLVTVVRTQYPDETPHIIPLSNVLEMRPVAGEKLPKK